MESVFANTVSSFLKGGGEMDELMRSHDWRNTPLGPPSQWPQNLQVTLGILLNSKFPMFLFWGDQAICFYNDAYRTSLGVGGKHPYALGKSGAEVWPGIWNNIKPQIDSILAGGEATWQEDQLLPFFQSGGMEAAYWTYSYSPVLDEAGRPAGVLVTCIETTTTVQQIQQLKNSNEKAKLAIEAGDLGVVEVDLVTQDVVISKRIEEIFNLKSGSDRIDFLRQMHPDDLLLREKAYAQAYRDGRLDYESRVFEDNGKFRWIRVKGTISFDAAKTPVKMVAVVQDITEQKQFSEELTRQVKERTEALEHAHQMMLASNAYLQSIINIFNTPLQVLEPVMEQGEVVDFIYKLTNEAYATYANKKPADLVGKRISDFFPSYFETDSFKNIREVAITGKAKLWDNHYPVDGLDIYNEMGAVKMNGDVVVHLTDFTKLKHLQLQLVRHIEELKRSNANLEEFAHAASHDLKEPVRKIYFFTSQLKDQLGEQLTTIQRRSFERIENATQRMASLIDDLLMYSHVSQKPQQMEEINLAEKVGRVVEDLELHIAEKNASIHMGDLPVIQGHRRQLQQLFQNLLSNAVKYSKPDVPPVIEIDATLAEENGRQYHVIAVTDNGIGFDEAYNEKVFHMFTRLHGNNEYSGTGVGLSIAKKVAENHDGFIQARSVPGEGSVFMVYLPVRPL